MGPRGPPGDIVCIANTGVFDMWKWNQCLKECPHLFMSLSYTIFSKDMGHLYYQNQSHLMSGVIRKASTFRYSYEVLLKIISLINQSLEVKLTLDMPVSGVPPVTEIGNIKRHKEN